MLGHNVLIIDFGSQVTQLIARRVREAGVFSEILPAWASMEEVKAKNPGAIILSGCPTDIVDSNAPALNPGILEMGIPVLGIGYGMQLLAQVAGSILVKPDSCDEAVVELEVLNNGADSLLAGFPKLSKVCLSCDARVVTLPEGFSALAATAGLPVAAMANPARHFYGVQFHPEVPQTEMGAVLIKNFLNIAGLKMDWNMASFVERSVADIKEKVGTGRVICALSGGVDSSVVAVLLNKAVGQNLTCIFVDHGLLRQGEVEEVRDRMANHYKLNLKVVDASDLFLSRLKGVDNPEEKRKIIGATFIEVFEAEAAKLGKVDFLAQGTIYPDVIESFSPFGKDVAPVKSHHNVGGLPEKMNMALVEPLRELFKDEVRAVGAELGMAKDFIWRQPFPGPGLGIRVIGPIDRERLDTLRQADSIVQEELRNTGLYHEIWQGFAVLLPLKTVGAKDHVRTYENVVALRAVMSLDAMTAKWARLPYDFLETVSSRIMSEVEGVNRVVYDISSKPPSTIEWE